MLCAGASLALPVFAQSGQVAPTREELERRLPQDPQPGTTLQVEGDLDRQPCALDSPEFADIRMTLNEVTFAGMEGVDPAVVRPA